MKTNKTSSTTIKEMDREEQLAVKAGQACPPFIEWKIEGYVGADLSTDGLYYHVWMGYYVGSFPVDSTQ